MSFIDGDGRFTVYPPPGSVGTPRAMRRKTARSLIELFRSRGGRSHYSATGGTLWVVARYLTEQGLRYKVTPLEHGWHLTVEEPPYEPPGS